MLTGRVLVTGADGFIGSHLVEALVYAGCDVRAFVHYSARNRRGWLDHADPYVANAVEVFAGDVRDAICVQNAAKGCAIILHLAALIGIPYSYLAPGSYIDTNINGTLNILQAARLSDVERVLVTSTSEVYGSAQYVPIDEAHPLQGQSPYSASKIGADQLALSYHLSFGLPVVLARPFNTFGPRQSARAVIPTVIGQIAAGRRQIRLGALSPTRDFNFVQDTVQGLIACASSAAAVGEVINLGSGFEISIGDAVRTIAEVMNADVEVVSDEQRMRPAGSEVQRLCADNGKAARLLGWLPQFGGLDGLKRGLGVTAEWFSNPDNLVHYRTDEYNL